MSDILVVGIDGFRNTVMCAEMGEGEGCEDGVL